MPAVIFRFYSTGKMSGTGDRSFSAVIMKDDSRSGTPGKRQKNKKKTFTAQATDHIIFPSGRRIAPTKTGCLPGKRAGSTRRKNTMEDQRENMEQDDPTPLTDEELAEFQRKEDRKIGIIGTIIDLIIDFFR